MIVLCCCLADVVTSSASDKSLHFKLQSFCNAKLLLRITPDLLRCSKAKMIFDALLLTNSQPAVKVVHYLPNAMLE